MIISNKHLSKGAAIVSYVARALVFFVALLHVMIAMVEIFLWKYSVIHSRLGFTLDVAKQVAPIVANAGLYNGFLAAGLIWGLLSRVRSYQIELFFLTCVFVAGIFGAFTLKWTTLVLQSAPAILAILAVWVARHSAELGTAVNGDE